MFPAAWAQQNGSALLEEETPEGEDELEAELFFSPNEVVTSAARHVQEIGKSPSAITVIGRQDIETSGANSIVDLLRVVPGLSVIMLSPFYTSLSARLDTNTLNYHFLVLVDGREANLEILGQTLWDGLPICLEDIERIEVIRGPASALYGANALAGVITITTRRASKRPQGYGHIDAGETGVLSARAGSSGSIGNWGLSMNVGADLADGFSNRSEVGKKVWKARSFVEYNFSDSERMFLEVSYVVAQGPVASTAGRMDLSYHSSWLQLAYVASAIQAHLYWTRIPIDIDSQIKLESGHIVFAEIYPTQTLCDTIDGEFQWSLPSFWKPLLLIAGAHARAFYIQSDELLDAQTFSDIHSEGYRRPGFSQWDFRTNLFLHSELEVTPWMDITGGVRMDYNTMTGVFVSPRLVVLFQPQSGHFIRAGVARAFRKPTPFESWFHPNVKFPKNTPLSPKDQDLVMDFMTRSIGNSSLDNEKLLSFEVGYLGRFWENRILVNLELYYNMLRDRIDMQVDIHYLDRFRPDFENSYFRFENVSEGVDVYGGELALSWQVTENLALILSWAHREGISRKNDEALGNMPKNQYTLGGNFKTGLGIVGSLYAFVRSDLKDLNVNNPSGVLDPFLTDYLDTSILFLGRLGYQFLPNDFLRMEAGMKLFLPLSPFDSELFAVRDDGGGISSNGQPYGADAYRRIFTLYLEGSF